MKAVFIIYHDILDERLEAAMKQLGIDYYTKWEDVKCKGHETDAHLGTRTFPGHNHVRLLAIDREEVLTLLIEKITELNKEVIKPDDKIRLFQLPLEKIV